MKFKNNLFSKLLITTSFILLSFTIGVINKAHNTTSIQQFNHLSEAISIAIKDITTGSQGYIGYSNVLKLLHINENESVEKSITNINQNINKSLKLIDSGQYDSEDNHILFNSEIGFVDYIKIAFTLFGFNFESLYFIYYLFFILSSFICLFYIYKDIEKFQIFSLFIIGIVCVQISIFVSDQDLYNYLQYYKLVSVNNARFITTLSIIPSLYLTLYLIDFKKFKFLPLVGFIINLIFLIFLFRIRVSMIWCFIPMIFFAIFFLVKNFFSNKIKARQVFLKIIFIILVPLSIILINYYDFSKKNIIYEKNTNLQNHAPAFMFLNGIFINDDLRKKYLGYERKKILDFDQKCQNNKIITFDRKLFCKLNSKNFSKKIIHNLFYKYNIFTSFRPYDNDVYAAGIIYLKKNNSKIDNLFIGNKEELDYHKAFLPYEFDKSKTINKKNLIEFEFQKHFNYPYMEKIAPKIIQEVILNNKILILKIFLIDKPINFLLNFILYFIIFNDNLIYILIIFLLTSLFFSFINEFQIRKKYFFLILIYFFSSISQNIFSFSHSQIIGDGSTFIFIYILILFILIFKKIKIKF